MKNLVTFLLLVFSLTAFGQSNSQAVEIKYWKSIAESNDTVAYREYLQRYGEHGLYYDEATTRIAMLKASEKKGQPNNAECCFYITKTDINKLEDNDNVYVFLIDDKRDEMWYGGTASYYLIRKNLYKSQDSYEYFFMKMKSEGSKPLTKDKMKSTSTRDVFFKRDIRKEWHKYNTGNGAAVSSTYNYPKPDGYWEEFQGYRYYAVSKDKSSMITWFENDENLDGIIHEKTYYYRVSKEDLLPKAVNYDFLNE